MMFLKSPHFFKYELFGKLAIAQFPRPVEVKGFERFVNFPGFKFFAAFEILFLVGILSNMKKSFGFYEYGPKGMPYTKKFCF